MSPDGIVNPIRPVIGQEGQSKASESQRSRRIYITMLLSLAMCVSFTDRYVLAMLVQPIKADLRLSDTQIGLITGFAFSAFYAVFGLLIARVSDRGWHRGVILASLAFWSIMTALCGAAQNFLHLLVARFGVGAGEAGVAPASHASITALFPPEQRSTALALFSAGAPTGILLAFAISGPLEIAIGWRSTFFVMGIPGLLLAILFALTVRALPAPVAVSRPKTLATSHSLTVLLASPVYRNLMLAISLVNLLQFGLPQWLPAYFERSFGMSRATLGPALAITQGLGMLIGMVLGGFLADWLARRDHAWRMRTIAFSAVIAIPFFVGIFIVGNPQIAFILAGISAFLFGISSGPFWSAVQDAAPPEYRASAAALVMMVASFAGFGCGPLLVGALSDLLEPRYHAMSLGPALLIAAIGGGLLLVCLLGLTMRAMNRLNLRTVN